MHVENAYASGQAKRPRGPRSSLTARRPSVDVQTQALAYYLQNHFQTVTSLFNIWGGLSECISVWKLSERRNFMVDLALSSMALAVFSRAQHRPLAATEASLRYHRLLRVAQEQVRQVGTSVSDENIDACLLAASLMGRYEGATFHRSDYNSKASFASMPCWSHHKGAMAILKVWSENPNRKTATGIVKHNRRDTIKCFLLRNLPLPDWVLNGQQFGEHGLELEYDCIIVRIVNLRYTLRKLLQKNYLHTAEAKMLSNGERELDLALQNWATQLYEKGSYEQHVLGEPDSFPKKYFYSTVVYSYPELAYGAIWGEYWAARLLVENTLLKILEATSSGPWIELTHEMQRLECTSRLKVLADSIASTVPFCLERVKAEKANLPRRQTFLTPNESEGIKPHLANLVVWPMTVASSLGGIDPQQQLWFKSELANLGKITGDGVLEYAETDEWGLL